MFPYFARPATLAAPYEVRRFELCDTRNLGAAPKTHLTSRDPLPCAGFVLVLSAISVHSDADLRARPMATLMFADVRAAITPWHKVYTCLFGSSVNREDRRLSKKRPTPALRAMESSHAALHVQRWVWLAAFLDSVQSALVRGAQS